jgi:hypothetical protein
MEVTAAALAPLLFSLGVAAADDALRAAPHAPPLLLRVVGHVIDAADALNNEGIKTSLALEDGAAPCAADLSSHVCHARDRCTLRIWANARASTAWASSTYAVCLCHVCHPRARPRFRMWRTTRLS